MSRFPCTIKKLTICAQHIFAGLSSPPTHKDDWNLEPMGTFFVVFFSEFVLSQVLLMSVQNYIFYVFPAGVPREILVLLIIIGTMIIVGICSFIIIIKCCCIRSHPNAYCPHVDANYIPACYNDPPHDANEYVTTKQLESENSHLADSSA